MDIFKEIEKWYSKNGISTSQFFKDNSTEVGRDEMFMDFAYRMLNPVKEPSITLEKDDSNIATFKNALGEVIVDWNDDAVCNYPEDISSYRDIGDLVNTVYLKGYMDGKRF